MKLLLNNFLIPGKQIKVAGSMEMRSEDISGETSGTDRAEKGIKPKMLRVSCIIPFTEGESLRALIQAAESKDNKGEQTIYTITNITANMAGVRQVVFVESLTWPENDTLQMWDINFSLQEHLSNPERVEQRQGNTTTTSSASKHQDVLKNVNGH